MSLKTQAWTCNNQGEKFELVEVELPPLEDTQVQVDMKYCGLCHTDSSMQNNEWGVSTYPLIAGHEGVGQISAVGRLASTSLGVGDLVGIGWMRGACGNCRNCSRGFENICEKGYDGIVLGKNAGPWGSPGLQVGCFSKVIRIESKFVFRLPNGLEAEKAGPLMCAGCTVWEPIMNHCGPGRRVGVVSLGGLGHMAIKMLSSTGAVITAISRGSAKMAKAKEFGAHRYLDRTDPEALKSAACSLDVIIDTNPASMAANGDAEDLGPLMDLLVFGGTFVKCGVPPTGFKYHFIPLVFTGRKIEGSVVSGSYHTKTMLETCAHHGIAPDVEVVPFEKVNECIENLLHGKNSKFRYVLKH